jgi:hypothetical protein
MLCDNVDGYALHIIVMSLADGVRLYPKFGFRTVAIVETKEGDFISMLRIAGLGFKQDME